jgi:hypothetical protein
MKSADSGKVPKPVRIQFSFDGDSNQSGLLARRNGWNLVDIYQAETINRGQRFDTSHNFGYVTLNDSGPHIRIHRLDLETSG